MASGADLFVVCKTCGSEVSAYVTECPYCGNRLRKRAPKLDRPGAPPRRGQRPRLRRASPRLGRLRPGEMPGIRFDRRPYAAIALVVASVAIGLVGRIVLGLAAGLAISGPLNGEWWRLLTAEFVYLNAGYLLCAAVAIGLFGWLLERRHGWWAPLLVFAAAGAGGMAAAVFGEPALGSLPLAVGGNGAALGLICAWVVPDLQERRRGGETDSDLLGVAAIAAVLVAMPLAAPREADPVAAAVGALIGAILGLVLSALSRR